jgi:hypothetical protein
VEVVNLALAEFRGPGLGPNQEHQARTSHLEKE